MATSRDVACPACGAKVGAGCRDGLTARTIAHAERTGAWRKSQRRAREKAGPSKLRIAVTRAAREAYAMGRCIGSGARTAAESEADVATAVRRTIGDAR
jgi:hypothetical protein